MVTINLRKAQIFSNQRKIWEDVVVSTTFVCSSNLPKLGCTSTIGSKKGEKYINLPDGFADSANPTTHLTRRVDVVRLSVLSEPLLTHQEELDHGRGQRVSVPAQSRDQTQHRPVERSVNL